jgi:ribosomal protein S27E
MPDEPRAPTPVPFSYEEAASIRKAFASRGAAVRCPRCQEPLTVTRSAEGEVWALSCERCRRILVMRRER